MSPEDGNRILYAGEEQLGDIDEWLERGWREYESNRQDDKEEDESEKCKNHNNKSTAKESDEDSSNNSERDDSSEGSENNLDEDDSDGTSSSDEVEVVEKPSTSLKGKQGKQKPAKPVPIKLGVRTWEVDDDTEGENAYGSDNEIPLNQTLLKDIVPGTPSGSSTTSTLTDDNSSALSEVLGPDSGYFMVNINAEIKPGMAHTARAIE